MSDMISRHYEAAKQEAKYEQVSIDGVDVGAFPGGRLESGQKEAIQGILSGWNISLPSDDFSTAIRKFQEHYNRAFNRNLKVNGNWGNQVRFALEIYHLALKAAQESGELQERNTAMIPPAADRVDLSQLVENSQDVKRYYGVARERLRESRNPNGTFYSPRVLKSGRTINLGALNTEGHGPYTSEHKIRDVLEDMGFSSVREFAEAYNKKFSHRPEKFVQRLIQNAESVDARLGKEDIIIGDEDFQNVRLAAMIWNEYEKIPRDPNTPIIFGEYSFSFNQLRSFDPSLKLEDALINSQIEAEDIDFLIKKFPNGKIPRLSDRIENMLGKIDSSQYGRLDRMSLPEGEYDALKSELLDAISVFDRNVEGCLIGKKYTETRESIHRLLSGTESVYSEEDEEISLTYDVCENVDTDLCYFGG